MRHLDISNWTADVFAKLVSLAEEAENLYAGHRVVGVGQSPAWMVYTLGLLLEAEGKPNDTDLLAFSGNFASRSGKKFTPDQSKYPDSTRLRSYFSYLAMQKNTPQDILGRYEDDPSQKTVFFDFIYEGEGFPSFIHLLMRCDQWLSRKQRAALTEACIFHSLRGSNNFSPIDMIHFVEQEEQDSFSISLISAKEMNDDIHYNLSGQKGEEEGHMGSDRLVPSFDISAKGQGKLLPTHNEARQNLIKAKIRDAVARLVQQKLARSQADKILPKHATPALRV